MPATSIRYRPGGASDPPSAPATAAASAPAPASCIDLLANGSSRARGYIERRRETGNAGSRLLRREQRAREEDRGLSAGDGRVGTEGPTAAPRGDALARELLDVLGGERTR